MFKMLVQVRRKPGMTDEAFFPRWQQDHGELVTQLAADMGFLAYIQTHRIGLPDACNAGTPSDGQAALWWPSRSAMEQALGSPAGIRASALLEVDEQAFTDTSALSALIADETVIIPGAGKFRRDPENEVKLMIEVRRRPDLAASAFADRLADSHAALVRELATDLGFLHYVQNHADRDAAFDFAANRGWLSPPDSIIEIWWPNEAALHAVLEGGPKAKALTRLYGDLDEIAVSRHSYVGRENIIFDFR